MIRHLRLAWLVIADEVDAFAYRAFNRHMPWSDWLDAQVIGRA